MNNIPELKSGYRVELRNGETYIAFTDIVISCLGTPPKFVLVNNRNSCLLPKNLCGESGISKIYNPPFFFVDYLKPAKKGDLIWQREPKQITISEALKIASDKYGCPVEIVKEEN